VGKVVGLLIGYAEGKVEHAQGYRSRYAPGWGPKEVEDHEVRGEQHRSELSKARQVGHNEDIQYARKRNTEHLSLQQGLRLVLQHQRADDPLNAQKHEKGMSRRIDVDPSKESNPQRHHDHHSAL
jgi:hypothetical protein